MNQHIPDLQKALRHFAKQIKFALNDFNTPLTYQTFWEQTEFVEDGNNAKDCMFNYLYTFADEKYPPYKQDYYEVLYKGNYLNLDANQVRHLTGLIGRLGIDTSKGFEDWHNVYLEIVFGEKGEYERYLSNPNTYSFDYQSVLKNDTPSVSEPEKRKIMTSLTLQQLKDKVNQHIGKAETEKAINLIIKWADDRGLEEIKNTIYHLRGQWTKLKQEDILGKMPYSERSIEEAKLTHNILKLLDSIDTYEP